MTEKNMRASVKMPDVPAIHPSSPVETFNAAPPFYKSAFVDKGSKYSYALNIRPFPSALAVHTVG